MAVETCPFCKTTLNEGAEVCHACGAQKGYGQAGQSKHVAGWIGLFMAGLTYFAFSSDAPLLSLMGLFTGGVTVWLLTTWTSNLTTKPAWYRHNRSRY